MYFYTKRIRDDKVEIACTKSYLKMFCYIGEWWQEEGLGAKGRCCCYVCFMHGRHLEMERNHLGLGYDMKEETRGLTLLLPRS